VRRTVEVILIPNVGRHEYVTDCIRFAGWLNCRGPLPRKRPVAEDADAVDLGLDDMARAEIQGNKVLAETKSGYTPPTVTVRDIPLW
jgi:hypothetical protein